MSRTKDEWQDIIKELQNNHTLFKRKFAHTMRFILNDIHKHAQLLITLSEMSEEKDDNDWNFSAIKIAERACGSIYAELRQADELMNREFPNE